MKRIIAPKVLREYAAKYKDAASSLDHWEAAVSAAEWKNPADLRQTFNAADRVTVRSGRTVFVFNIQGNAHRLVAAIHFKTGMVYVLRLMPHKEYDLDRWKQEL